MHIGPRAIALELLQFLTHFLVTQRTQDVGNRLDVFELPGRGTCDYEQEMDGVAVLRIVFDTRIRNTQSNKRIGEIAHFSMRDRNAMPDTGGFDFFASEHRAREFLNIGHDGEDRTAVDRFDDRFTFRCRCEPTHHRFKTVKMPIHPYAPCRLGIRSLP